MSAYTCAMCGGTFETERPDQEAVAEMRELWGSEMTKESCEVVCDDCFKELMKDLQEWPPRA